VASLLDYEIQTRTGRAKGLDDLERVLFESYSAFHGGGVAKSCDNDCILRELNALTGSDFTRFFDRFVFGSESLPLDWLGADDDGDSLVTYEEILFGTSPNKGDTDGDGYSDAVEIASGTDPLDPFSVPSLIYLPLAVRR
jgi:hypothetical protein